MRPPMVPLDALGAGLLRDLEGVATDAVSQSDLAFHALREYAPGDDLRHVHWRSSAKAMASGGESQLLVRQYLDTRRSHATIVVDDARGFLGRGRRRETTSRPRCRWPPRSSCARCSTTSRRRSCAGGTPPRASRATSRSTPSVAPAWARPGWSARPTGPPSIAADTSLLFLLTGGAARRSRRCCVRRPPSRRRYAGSRSWSTRAATAGVTEAGGVSVLRLAGKDDLAGLLRWSVR